MLCHILPVPKYLLLWQIQKPQPISEAKHKQISFLGKHLSPGNIIWHTENMPKHLHSAGVVAREEVEVVELLLLVVVVGYR
jgi:hypothetical protein